MAFREEIKLVVDVVTGNTTSALRTLRTDLDNADGAFGKMRVAGGAAFDFIKANAASFGVAAAGAVATFAAKAVGDFQDVALGAGELRDALGITAEEASQLQEVAGDLGIGVDAVSTAIGRMNRTAATSPGAFDEIGASIRRNKDGTIDVIATFESAAEAISKIPDAAKRAEAGQKIFGRGWQDISELIMEGADGIKDAFKGVERQKVVTDAQINQARTLRDNFDQMKGRVESLSLAVGNRLVPALNDAFVIGEQLGGILEDLKIDDALSESWYRNLEQPLQRVSKGLEIAQDLFDSTDDIIGTVRKSAKDAADEGIDPLITSLANMAGLDVDHKLEGFGDAMDDAADDADKLANKLDKVAREWDELMGTIDDDQALLDVHDSFADLKTAADEAWFAAASGSDEASQKQRDYQSEVNHTKQLVADYGREVLGLSPQQVTRIIADIDNGSVDRAEKLLVALSKDRTTTISVVTKGKTFARGGTVGSEGGIAGEAGLEALEFPGGLQALVNSPTAVPPGTVVTPINGSGGGSAGFGGGGVVIHAPIYIQAGMGADAHEIARVLQPVIRDVIARDVRFNGPGGYRNIIGAA